MSDRLLVAEFIIGKLAVLKPIDGHNMTSHCVPMFRTIAVEQSAHIQNIYDEIAGPIALPLQSRMPDEIRQNLSKQIGDHAKKVELMVELECKAADSMSSKEVFTLRPTLYGVGVDLKELWKKFFP